MRYALRNQDKISAEYSPKYLKEHIIASLDRFFSSIQSMEDYEVYIAIIGEKYSTGQRDYDILRINDAIEMNSMIEFAWIGTQYDIIKLAFLGRVKG